MSNNLHQAQSHEVMRSWQSLRNDVNNNKDFVLPMFIGNQDDSIEVIESMPEVYRYGCNKAIAYLEPLVYNHGLSAVLLFPVITKSDKTENHNDDYKNDDNDEDVDADIVDSDLVSSSDSSASSRRSSLQSSSSCSSDEDNQQSTVKPQRLIPIEDPDLTGPILSLNSQNPFLNENEEEDHLLGDQSDLPREDDASLPLTNASLPKQPALHHRIHRQSSKDRATMPIMKKDLQSLDVKLIRSLALRDENNPVLRLIPKLREKFPKLLIICDVCLCAFTSTGHCCLFDDHSVASDPSAVLTKNMSHYNISAKVTCQYLSMLAVEYASRGCDVVAPSDMMDGRIAAINEKLLGGGFNNVAIMSYSAKFASAFYGPFRQATNNAPQFGDRRAYQLPPGSRTLAMRAVKRDIDQGASFIMVKPAGCYLDIVRDIHENHPEYPIAVYQVSGEYSMLKMAAKAGIVDLKLAVNELLTSYRRAGASIIITYFTPELLTGKL